MRTLRASSDSADERLRPRHNFYTLEIGSAGWGAGRSRQMCGIRPAKGALGA
ncbi:hypothetical protein K523DRAFT_359315 [Schizophyllum commune Tattone D]|nr:hypothetical protein K523DRAFT_359315 [Schizophyllum commune Tattone D]